MSVPPLTTLILENPNGWEPGTILGIDTQFFTVTHFLKGIKLIPAGAHFLHVSSTDEGAGLRRGWWFQSSDNCVVKVQIDEDKATFTGVDAFPATFSDDYAFMVSYPEDLKKWKKLAGSVTMEVVEEYVWDACHAVSTATPLAEENMTLADILRQKQTSAVADCDELRYTIVDQRLRPNTEGSLLTQYMLDRTWLVTKLFGPTFELLLAEIQLCHLHFILLGNICSYTQWVVLLQLVLCSGEFLRQNPQWRASLEDVLVAQVQALPEEYASMGVVEVDEFLAVLRNLYDNGACSGELEAAFELKLGIVLDLETRFDTDNFEIYDIEHHADDDEDAPAIVF